MPLKIVRDDITKVKADAIVNSANKNPICGGGAEYSIYEAAGREALLAAREKVGELKVAEIAVTPAFALNAKYIIHTVGPRWNGGVSGETIALANCYRGAIHHIGNVHKYAREEDRAANYVNDGEGIKTMYMAECCLMSDIRKNRVNTRAWKRNVDADFARRGNK